MADNVTLNAGSGGAVLATDDIASVHHQRVKIEVGADGVAADVQLASADFDTGGGVQTQHMIGIALPASGGAVPGGTSSAPIRTDPTGATTQPVSGSVSVSGTVTANAGTGFEVQYEEDTPHVSADKVTLAGVVQQSADAALSGDGDRSLLQVDASGFLKVNVKTGGVGGTQYDEDTVSAAADKITMAGVVRKDTAATLVDLDGDRTQLQVDAVGRLHVNGSGVTQPVSGSVNIGTFPDNEPFNVAQVGGTPVATGSGVGTAGTQRVTLATDDVVTVELPADTVTSGSLTAAGQAVTYDRNNGFNAVGVQVTGTWTGTLEFEVTIDGTNWESLGVVRNSSNIFVLSTTSNGIFFGTISNFSQFRVRASALSSGTANVTILSATADAGTNAVSIGNFGVSLPIGVNNIGDVDVLTLPALVAGTANIGDVDVLTLPALVAGSANIGDVDVLTIAAGDNNIGNVDIVTLPALVAGTANIGDVDVLTLPALVAGTANIGDVDVLTLPALVAGTANIGDVDVLTLPALVAGTANIGDVDVLTGPTGTSSLQQQGNIAHDSPDSTSNPIKVGAKAINHGTNPTAVANADRTDCYANRAGVPFVVGGHPNSITRTSRVAAADGAQTGAAISPTVGTTERLMLTRISAQVSSACTAGNYRIKIAFSTSTTLPTDALAGTNEIVLDNVFAPGAGIIIGDGTGLVAVGAADKELRITCDSPVGGHLTVSFTYFTIDET